MDRMASAVAGDALRELDINRLDRLGDVNDIGKPAALMRAREFGRFEVAAQLLLWGGFRTIKARRR